MDSVPDEPSFRFGVVPVVNPASGGVYQYSLTMMRALASLRSQRADDFVVFVDGHRHDPIALGDARWEVRRLTPPTLRARAGTARTTAVERLPRRIRSTVRAARKAVVSGAGPPAHTPLNADAVEWRPDLRMWFAQCGIDLVLYPLPTRICFESSTPYVVAIHDLQHRLQPHFPEVSADGEAERREYLFRNAIRYATLILVDSDVGREDVLNVYGDLASPDQVHVLPFLPPPYLAAGAIPDVERSRVRNAYHLPDRYLFYPAQFWPHKNHGRVVDAVGALKRDGLRVDVVFAGSAPDEIRRQTLAGLHELSRTVGVEEQIRFISYVEEEDMAAIYGEAVALVMPTFFGPTNIPVLEAWAVGCPVVTSDLRGIREQTGDAAALVDPRSSASIADGIRRVWTDESARAELAERGRRRLELYGPDEYRTRLAAVLDAARARCRPTSMPAARAARAG